MLGASRASFPGLRQADAWQRCSLTCDQLSSLCPAAEHCVSHTFPMAACSRITSHQGHCIRVSTPHLPKKCSEARVSPNLWGLQYGPPKCVQSAASSHACPSNKAASNETLKKRISRNQLSGHAADSSLLSSRNYLNLQE